MTKLAILLCNLLWLLSCLPRWLLFIGALRVPRWTQTRLLRRLLWRSRRTVFGVAHDFAATRTPEAFASRVPPADYEAFAPAVAAARGGGPYDLHAGRVERLVPTSGSSGSPKLIPYTAALRQEFRDAVDPWLAWLFLAHPRLLLGRHYWAISPSTPPQDDGVAASAVPVGFAADASYLGPVGRLLARALLVAPAGLQQVGEAGAFARLTLFHLLREPNLRLISVWHPSFLTALLDALPGHLDAILGALRTGMPPGPFVGPRLRPLPRRAAELAALDLARCPERIGLAWPHLAVISCWTEGRPEPWLGRLRAWFPRAGIQGKGLMATEGAVTIPTGCGRLHPCAVRSHYLEFLEPASGVARRLWELAPGATYSVLLTTGGGLWRYRLHDLVRVDGFCGRTPSLSFLGKDNAVSDLVGEKLDERHAAEALAAAAAATGLQPAFAMLEAEWRDAPRGAGYVLHLELARGAAGESDAVRFADAVEAHLRRNYHYDHARGLGQLGPLRTQPVVDGAAAQRARAQADGALAAVAKLPALRVLPGPRPAVDAPRVARRDCNPPPFVV